MFSILTHSHSGLRYIVLFLIIALIVQSIKAFMSKVEYNQGIQKLANITVYVFYLNVIIGFILYYLSSKVQFGPDTMKESLLRFFTMEHPLMILISLILIRIGIYRYKKLKSLKGNKVLMIYTIIGLITLIAAIPWPMRTALNIGWF